MKKYWFYEIEFFIFFILMNYYEMLEIFKIILFFIRLIYVVDWMLIVFSVVGGIVGNCMV